MYVIADINNYLDSEISIIEPSIGGENLSHTGRLLGSHGCTPGCRDPVMGFDCVVFMSLWCVLTV